MPRKGEVPKRDVSPDPKYKSRLVQKFINGMMKEGKKSVAERIMYDAFDIIEKTTKQSPLKVFEQAMEHAKPRVEVKSRRVGGSTYQVPVEVRRSRQVALGIRWLITFARKRSEKTMAERLARELMDAASRRGATIKKREETHRMAEANKAFAHYRW
ncbi:MAG: 30S ribosomal protein S7 [Deltaproteobacteria bacterium]|nr:30S ribosomal protein S7 [Deltaproteobacteria bacterium]MCD6138304.1 30S ribosomal protein S7 [Deltaproteobacteria bacterium]RLB92193.1 MAG: 30S ribosomal protein S7 [Deltaproteobacteria bacterium]RLC12787.1 MAG: 30S ribosomal protein S7 [Deltaproteobacteria bacterium]